MSIQFNAPICNDTDLIDRFIPQNSVCAVTGLIIIVVDGGGKDASIARFST